MKTLFLRVFTLLGIVILLASCEKSFCIDSHRVTDASLKIISEGEVYYHSLNYFKISDDEKIYRDTILLEDGIQTSNTGFSVERQAILLQYTHGNYTILRCLYKANFGVIVISWAHGPIYRNLPFYFEAEEVWLNGQKISEHPWVFEKIKTDLTELPVSEEELEDIDGKYLLDFQLVAHNRYYEYQTEMFRYKYYVTRLKKSDLYISPDDVSVVVTYDWHPD